ncbi:hypothetical protein OKA05_22795 [Luteolibacter arcticus]|uniref:Uncharacterized protein n=1 Tax=Luteolibacter arcticus TaxID=1581411 RepID=A0ABT3GPG3_9BACT|nr:hypothetical protein [Luteolibacter arcticus]MCW1925407.1 hypothetical protein [Luteolibacter arcticus]
MGLLTDIFFGDLSQSFSIDEHRSALKSQAMKQAESSGKLFNATMEIDRLKRQNGELRLAVTALTRFLIDRKVVDGAELEAFVREIDAEDGKIDGALAFPPPPKPGPPKRGPR